MNERLLQLLGGLIFVFMAWVLTAVMGSIQADRVIIYDLLDRVSALEERVIRVKDASG